MERRAKRKDHFFSTRQCLKQHRGPNLTVAVCAVVPVPRLHNHSVRSLKWREGRGAEVIKVHANTETQKLRYAHFKTQTGT